MPGRYRVTADGEPQEVLLGDPGHCLYCEMFTLNGVFCSPAHERAYNRRRGVHVVCDEDEPRTRCCLTYEHD